MNPNGAPAHRPGPRPPHSRMEAASCSTDFDIMVCDSTELQKQFVSEIALNRIFIAPRTMAGRKKSGP